MIKSESTYPYITILEHNDQIYYGLIKIKSKQYITIYCLNDIPEDFHHKVMELGKKWWWQSNRQIPISLFMLEDMEMYECYTRRFNTDSVKVISGPVLSINELPTKRIKRRNTTLKKKK